MCIRDRYTNPYVRPLLTLLGLQNVFSMCGFKKKHIELLLRIHVLGGVTHSKSIHTDAGFPVLHKLGLRRLYAYKQNTLSTHAASLSLV